MIYNVETATKLSSLPREYIRVRHPVEGIFFLSHWIFYLKNFGKNPHDTILSKTRHRTLYQWDYGNVQKWPGRPTGAGPKAVVGTCAFFPSPLVSTFKLFKTMYVHFSSVQLLSRVRLFATP